MFQAEKTMSHRLVLNIATLKAFSATRFDCNLVPWPGNKTYYKHWAMVLEKPGCYKGNDRMIFLSPTV